MSAQSAGVATEEKHEFQAEVSRLLDIVAHSLYSDRRVFLRELISNASDACDRLRYEAITRPELTVDDGEFRVTLAVDKAARLLAIVDNGMGMNHDDLVENFYSAFMVADRVDVLTRKAGDDKAWRWTSGGLGAYSIAPAERAKRGTTVTLHLREDAAEFLEPDRLRAIVRQYSDHIALPIVLLGEKEGDQDETINRASALWMRSRNDIAPEQYREFYAHVAHAPMLKDAADPWLTLHWRAEGKIEYASLLFIPSSRPYDLYLPERRHGVKLYVKRVYITDKAEGLLPGYLRFLRGVVDSEDLPLNISREMLQHNPILVRIRAGLVARVLGELEKKAKDAPDDYARFWENFGPVLKEGLYEDPDHREALLGLARFGSTAGPGIASLADYVGRLKPGQEAIYYVAGDDPKALAASPQIEGYAKRGIEVLLFADPVDEFWVASVGAYQGKKFKSVTRGAADLSKIPLPEGTKEKEKPAADGADIGALVALFRLALQDRVKDVRASERLTDSAVCLVADESDIDIHMERLLRQHHQLDASAKRILEVNPDHPLIGKLNAELARPDALNAERRERIEEAAHLLLDQALIVEGEPLADPVAFARRMASALARGFI
ncbi:MAG: molecular chaperone HtpG [Rhodospirillales bacterium]|nr:molecular chaperone HtpG [Rhodospirillales bacterium]